jgi:hypothetical protein
MLARRRGSKRRDFLTSRIYLRHYQKSWAPRRINHADEMSYLPARLSRRFDDGALHALAIMSPRLF